MACAYTNRYHGNENERGMRVCYSYDDGETWDVEHPAILRDYNAHADAQCLWNFVQVSDGTLFASGWALIELRLICGTSWGGCDILRA